MQLYPGLMQLKSDISGQSDVDGSNVLRRGPMGIEVQGSGAVAETRIVRLIEPLKERRRILLASKEMHQVTQDLEDEIVSLLFLILSILSFYHVTTFLITHFSQYLLSDWLASF